MLSINKYSHSPIARKLLFITIGISTLIALLITIIQLTHDYYQNVQRIENTLQQIKIANIPSIVVSIWDLDHKQVKTQLQSLMKIPEVKRVEVLQEKYEPISYGTFSDNDYFLKIYSFELIGTLKDGAKQTKLGMLNITYDFGPIYIGLIEKLALIFFLNCLKTLTVSFIILFFFWKLVTSHIVNITEQIGQYKDVLSNKKYIILNDQDSLGEIGSLIHSINKLYSYIADTNKSAAKSKLSIKSVESEFIADYNLLLPACDKNLARSLIIKINKELTLLLKEVKDCQVNNNKIICEVTEFSDKITKTLNRKRANNDRNTFIYMDDIYSFQKSFSAIPIKNHLVVESDIFFSNDPMVIKRLLWTTYFSIYNFDQPSYLKTSIYKKHMNIYIVITYSCELKDNKGANDGLVTSSLPYYAIEAFIQNELKGSITYESDEELYREWVITFPSQI